MPLPPTVLAYELFEVLLYSAKLHDAANGSVRRGAMHALADAYVFTLR